MDRGIAYKDGLDPSTPFWYLFSMDTESRPEPVAKTTKSVRFPDPLWDQIKAYQRERMLSTELAAHRELLEKALAIRTSKRDAA